MCSISISRRNSSGRLPLYALIVSFSHFPRFQWKSLQLEFPFLFVCILPRYSFIVIKIIPPSYLHKLTYYYINFFSIRSSSINTFFSFYFLLHFFIIIIVPTTGRRVPTLHDIMHTLSFVPFASASRFYTLIFYIPTQWWRQ